VAVVVTITVTTDGGIPANELAETLLPVAVELPSGTLTVAMVVTITVTTDCWTLPGEVSSTEFFVVASRFDGTAGPLD
jgi:hypothetical protein